MEFILEKVVCLGEYYTTRNNWCAETPPHGLMQKSAQKKLALWNEEEKGGYQRLGRMGQEWLAATMFQ